MLVLTHVKRLKANLAYLWFQIPMDEPILMQILNAYEYWINEWEGDHFSGG